LTVDLHPAQFAAVTARRRWVFLACLATALVGGIAAGVVAPRILVGGTSHPAAPTADEAFLAARAAVGPLGLSDRLHMDPQEIAASQRRWAAMTPAQRQTVLARYRQVVEMDPADRDLLLVKYAALRQLPPDRQADLRKRAAGLAEFRKTLSPQDVAVLESMTETQRASRLLELWQAHDGL
jgi:hypothetical protein